MAIKYGRPLPGNTVSLTDDTVTLLNSGAIGAPDIAVDYSTADDWVQLDPSGQPTILVPFTDLHTRIENTTSGNKVLLVHFKATQVASSVGLGSYGTGSFRNVKIELLGSGGVIRTVVDDSADSTPMQSRLYRFTEESFNAIRITFVTTEAVTISNIAIKCESPVSVSQRDLTTDSLKIISHEHYEIHEGEHYMHKETYSLLKNGILEHLIITPDSMEWAHMVIGVEANTSTIRVSFYEAPTYSAVGTPDPAINRNRNFPDDNSTLIYEAPTLITPGTRLWTVTLGSGKNTSGGGSRDSNEIVLRQNTAYMLRITELNIDATVVNLSFDWYEHINNNLL